MASLLGPNGESYDEYFYKWSEGQLQLCEDLHEGLNRDLPENELQEMVDQVQKHYREYYRAKDGAAKQDVLKVLQPPWRSPLENAFLWIGGWRPTMVFQLAYAQAGQQIEAELADFLNGLDTPTMASLTSKQLSQISSLQVRTQNSEEELGHQEGLIQQSLADQPLLSLAQAHNQAGESSASGGQGSIGDVMDDKVKELEELMCSADELRIQCLQEFLKILTITQAAQYLVAAGQLFTAMRKIGKEREEESPVKNAVKNGEPKPHSR